MLFTLDPAPTFPATVTLTAPGGERRELRVVFRHKPRSAALAWIEAAAQRPKDEEPDILLDILADWIDVDAELSREAIARLIDNHYQAGIEILTTYMETLNGARLGN